MSGDLHLFFPQWQGSGPGRELWHGAQCLRGWLPELPFRDVPVSLDPLPCGGDRVLGCGVLLRQQRAASELIEGADPDRIYTLGGDCGVETMPISWLHRKHAGGLTVIWLDAHGDLNTPESSPSGHFHGMPLRCLLDGGPHPLGRACGSRLAADQVILAGTRDLDAPERSFVQETGLRLLTPELLAAAPWLLAQCVPQDHAVYLHLDLDVLDPDDYPWVQCPSPGGLSPEILLAVLDHLRAERRLVGISVLEGLATDCEAARELVRSVFLPGTGILPCP